MAEAVSVQAAPAPVVLDFDHAYKLGTLSGEVRLLKWAVAAAFVAILGGMGALYDAIDDVRVELVETRKDISVLRTDTVGIQKDVTAIDTRVATIEKDVAVLKTDVAVLKTDVAVLKTDVAVLKTDVADLKTDVADLKTDVADLKTDVADLKTMHSSSVEDAHRGLGDSRALPSHIDSAGQSVPPAPATPPA